MWAFFVAHLAKLCYNFIRLGKQVQILYEPVAVRHMEILGILPEKHNGSVVCIIMMKPQFGDRSLEKIREGRFTECQVEISGQKNLMIQPRVPVLEET